MKRAWEDPALDAQARLDALLAWAREDAGRGGVKAAGTWLDREGQALRALLLARIDEPEAADWPGKKLLRRALDREPDAHAPGNPTHLDEGFVCAACGAEVPPNGRMPRDHCPRCLRSLHVDVVPGDRASTCRGRMEPVGVRITGDDVVLRYRCQRCGEEHNNRAVRVGVMPDDWAAIVALSREPGR